VSTPQTETTESLAKTMGKSLRVGYEDLLGTMGVGHKKSKKKRIQINNNTHTIGMELDKYENRLIKRRRHKIQKEQQNLTF